MSSPEFFRKTNKLIRYYHYATCFCSFFGRNWRHQENLSKLPDLWEWSSFEGLQNEKRFNPIFARSFDNLNEIFNEGLKSQITQLLWVDYTDFEDAPCIYINLNQEIENSEFVLILTKNENECNQYFCFWSQLQDLRSMNINIS